MEFITGAKLRILSVMGYNFRSGNEGIFCTIVIVLHSLQHCGITVIRITCFLLISKIEENIVEGFVV